MEIHLGKQEAWKRLCLILKEFVILQAWASFCWCLKFLILRNNGTHFRVEYEEETKNVFEPFSVMQVRRGTPSVLTSDGVSFTVRIKATP